jgi:DNA-binding HxlR family transcriptional regulator
LSSKSATIWFEDFQGKLGIASDLLTNRLKLLCDEGVVERLPDE